MDDDDDAIKICNKLQDGRVSLTHSFMFARLLRPFGRPAGWTEGYHNLQISRRIESKAGGEMGER